MPPVGSWLASTRWAMRSMRGSDSAAVATLRVKSREPQRHADAHRYRVRLELATVERCAHGPEARVTVNGFERSPRDTGLRPVLAGIAVKRVFIPSFP